MRESEIGMDDGGILTIADTPRNTDLFAGVPSTYASITSDQAPLARGIARRTIWLISMAACYLENRGATNCRLCRYSSDEQRGIGRRVPW
jgi:hypothetical protein